MEEIKSNYQKFRQKTHVIIYGTNTIAGKTFDLVLLAIILLSVFLTMLETVSGFETRYHDERIILEWIITIFFTLEYILRIISIDKPFKYIFSFYGIIDLVATLPMYLSFIFTGAGILSIARALRLLRLFKILNHPKFSKQSNHLKNALIESRGKILIFIYFVLISSIIIGTLMYVIEGKESGFTSIPMSIYWTIVTLTTVGYGDISPITPLGQFLASFVMILGYGIIAVPTGLVSAEIAKSTLKNNNDTKCKKCFSVKHDSKANYCYNCGELL